jgi:hypothetical protein
LFVENGIEFAKINLLQEVYMTKQELLQKLARLESANDQLVSEIAYIDRLMRLVGFTEGLASLKATALELYEGQNEEEDLAA